MTGDQQDLVDRIKAALPRGWFAEYSPIVAAVLAGIASALSFVYDLYAYAQQQTRIATASDAWLDLISADFFGALLPRNGRTDAGFRAAIIARLFRERATRAGMVGVLTDLTGNAPVIFEPGRVADGMALGFTSYLGAVPLGATNLPYQAFITVKRAPGTGIPTVAGLGSNEFGLGQSPTAALVNMDQIMQSVTDSDIYAAIQATKPAGTVMWVAISD